MDEVAFYFASITFGVSCLMLSPRVEKEISWSAEKFWVVFCLVIRYQMDVLVCVVTLIPVKLAELVLVLVFCGPGHGWRCLELHAAATFPLRKAVVTLIISSTDFGMLLFSFLIRSGLVIPCMNPYILMHSGAPLTCILSALNLSMKASVDSPSLCLIWWISTRGVSLSDAWVTGRGSPYYPVDNKVVAVRDVDVLPRCPVLCLLLLLVWSWVTIYRVAGYNTTRERRVNHLLGVSTRVYLRVRHTRGACIQSYRIQRIRSSIFWRAKSECTPDSLVAIVADSKRPEKNTPQCYTKPLDSLKNWNNRFFWVDERVFPTVVDWRTNALKDGTPVAGSYSVADVAVLNTRHMDLFNLISASNPTKVKTETRPYAAHEVPLLTVTANRVIDMGDAATTSESLRTPSTIEKSSLDFANEDPPQTIIERGRTEYQGQDGLSWEIPPVDNPMPKEVAPNLGKEMAVMGPTINKRSHKWGKEDTGANAPRKVLRRDHDTSRLTQSTLGGKSLAAMGLKTSSTFSAPADMSDPDPLSFVKPQSYPERDVAYPESAKSVSILSGDGSPGGIYHPGWGVINSCRLDTPDACQDVVNHIAPPGYFSELRYLPNADFLSQYNMNLARKVAMSSQLRLSFEQDVRLLKKARAKIARRDQRILMREEEIKKLNQEVKSLKAVEVEVHGLRIRTKNLETLLEAEVNNDQLSQQVTNLQTQVVSEEKIKAAFEAFKKYKDDRVEQRCAEMDARLNKLSVDFDEELYLHMLTAIAGRRWVIGHGLRLAIMKCAESSELRQAFDNVVFAGLAKGMSEGLKYEKLKDAPMEVIMASLYLESDSGEDAPQWIRDLRLSYSQLKIPIYHEVRNPEDPWAIKEEMSLEDAIATNISRAEKKRKCRVVCRTHEVGSAHHARSDGIPVSVSTVAPQGLAILLADAATQTEDEVSSRLLRSKSLPPMYNLDWP
ncbi:hypothetical protein Tco_0329365 [Tanacetum coccineum]